MLSKESIYDSYSRILRLVSRDFITSNNYVSLFPKKKTVELLLGHFFFATVEKDLEKTKNEFENAGFTCFKASSKETEKHLKNYDIPKFKDTKNVLFVISNKNVSSSSLKYIKKIAHNRVKLTFSNECFVIGQSQEKIKKVLENFRSNITENINIISCLKHKPVDLKERICNIKLSNILKEIKEPQKYLACFSNFTSDW